MTLRKITTQFTLDSKGFVTGAKDIVSKTKSITFSSKEAAAAYESAFGNMDKSVKMTSQELEAHLVKIKKIEREANKNANAYNRVTSSLKNQAHMLTLTNNQQQVYLALQKLGANATDAQKVEVEELVMAQQRLAVKTELANNATEKQAKASKRATANFEQLSNEYKHLTIRTGQSAERQEKMNALQRLGAGATLTQRKEILKLVQAQQMQVKASASTQKSMRGLRGQAQNLGWQLQDVAVQAQMGTSAFVILGQQGSQLASGFGAQGALIGAGIAVASALAGVAISTYKAKKGIGDLEKITQELNEAFKEGVNGAEVLSEKILKIAQRSESLARIEIAKGVMTAEKQIKTAISEIVDVLDEVDTYSIGDGFVAAQNSTGKSVDQILASTKRLGDLGGTYFRQLEASVSKVQSAFKISRDQAVNLGIAIDRAFTEKSPIAIKTLENAIGDLNEETGGTNKKVVELAGKLVPLFTSITTGTDRANLFRTSFFDLKGAIKDAGEEAKKTDFSSFGFEALDYGYFFDFMKTRKSALDEQFEEDQDRAKQARDLGLASEEEYQAKLLEIKSDYYKEDINARERLEEKLTDEGKLSALKTRYDKEYELLDGNLSAQSALVQNYERDKIKISGTYWEQYALAAKENLGSFDDQVANSLDRFSAGFGDAVGNAIFESDNLGDAMGDIFKSAAKNMISFYAEMAIQKGISWALDQTISTGKIGLDVAERAATAPLRIAGATSMALNAQAMAVQASLSAYASTAAIPFVGAALAPAAATTAYAAGQAMATTIGNVAFAGAFDKGGLIPSGSAGIVAEYGDELVGGTMIYNGSQSSLSVTGREDTARMTSNSNKNTFNINSYGAASPEAIARATARALKKGSKVLDNAVYDSANRGRKNGGKRYA